MNKVTIFHIFLNKAESKGPTKGVYTIFGYVFDLLSNKQVSADINPFPPKQKHQNPPGHTLVTGQGLSTPT